MEEHELAPLSGIVALSQSSIECDDVSGRRWWVTSSCPKLRLNSHVGSADYINIKLTDSLINLIIYSQNKKLYEHQKAASMNCFVDFSYVIDRFEICEVFIPGLFGYFVRYKISRWDNSLKDDPHRHIEIRTYCWMCRNSRKSEHGFKLEILGRRTMIYEEFEFRSFSRHSYSLSHVATAHSQTSGHRDVISSVSLHDESWNLYFWVSWMRFFGVTRFTSFQCAF